MPLKCAKLFKLTKKRGNLFMLFCAASSQFHASLLITGCAVMYIIPLCKTTIINITLFVGNSIFERIKIRSANNLSRYEKVKKHIFWLFVFTWRTIFEALINRLVKKVILRANVFCCCLPQNDQKTEVLPTAIAREETHNIQK